MSMSLRDQLLQAGLISQKQAKEAERQADQAQRSKHQAPKAKRAAPPVSAPLAASIAAKPVAPTSPDMARHDIARPATTQAAAQAAKVARDQALSRKQLEKAKKKALQAQIKQLIEQNRLPLLESDEPYNFVDENKIRRITINAQNRAALARGEIHIVRHEGRYDLVPAAAAARIRERDTTAVVAIIAASDAKAAEDGYEGFAVPDDLIW